MILSKLSKDITYWSEEFDFRTLSDSIRVYAEHIVHNYFSSWQKLL